METSLVTETNVFSSLGEEKVQSIFKHFDSRGSGRWSHSNFYSFLSIIPNSKHMNNSSSCLFSDFTLARNIYNDTVSNNNNGDEEMTFTHFLSYYKTYHSTQLREHLRLLQISANVDRTEAEVVCDTYSKEDTDSINVFILQEVAYALKQTVPPAVKVREGVTASGIKNMKRASLLLYCQWLQSLPDEKNNTEIPLSTWLVYSQLRLSSCIRYIHKVCSSIGNKLPAASLIEKIRGVKPFTSVEEMSRVHASLNVGDRLSSGSEQSSFTLTFNKQVKEARRDTVNNKSHGGAKQKSVNKKRVNIKPLDKDHTDDVNALSHLSPLERVNAPMNAKCFVCIDLSIDPHVPDRVVNKEILPTAERFLHQELTPVLKISMPHYIEHKVQVVEEEVEGEHNRILRVMIFSGMDIEYILKECGLQDSVLHMVQSMTLHVLSSVSPSSILLESGPHRNNNINETLQMDCQLQMEINIPAIGRILEVLINTSHSHYIH